MITPRLSVAFVGVAIATALVPPLASSAICLARGDYRLAFGALLLAFTNIVAIQVACSLVMWLGGYRGTSGNPRGATTEEKSGQCCPIAHSRARSRDRASRGDCQRGLRGFGAPRPGDSIHYSQRCLSSGCPVPTGHGDDCCHRSISNALAFHSGRSWNYGTRLPTPDGKTKVQLRIRSIPVTVASKQGYLESPEDLTDQRRSQE